MVRTIANRILWLISVLLAVTAIVFVIVHLSGDPTDGFVDPGASPDVRDRIRAKHGLDDPLPAQYLRFVRSAATGDFGESWRADQPALELVLDRLGQTVRLACLALVLAVTAGVALGSTIARDALKFVSLPLRMLIAISQALPSFWVGAMLVLIFAVNLGWLPSSGGGSLEAIVLPAVTLALQPAAMIAGLVDTQLRESLRADFVRTARGKGLPERTVVLGHALRSSLGPILAFLGIQIGFLLGGAVVVEGVFAYPGVGLLALNAVQDRDLPIIQAFVVVMATVICLTTIAIDLLARSLDPRIAHGGAAS